MITEAEKQAILDGIKAGRRWQYMMQDMPKEGWITPNKPQKNPLWIDGYKYRLEPPADNGYSEALAAYQAGKAWQFRSNENVAWYDQGLNVPIGGHGYYRVKPEPGDIVKHQTRIDATTAVVEIAKIQAAINDLGIVEKLRAELAAMIESRDELQKAHDQAVFELASKQSRICQLSDDLDQSQEKYSRVVNALDAFKTELNASFDLVKKAMR